VITGFPRAGVVAALTVLVVAGCAAPPSSTTPSTPPASPSAQPIAIDVSAELDALELEYDARVGVSAIDTGSGDSVAFRADERFGFASTVKVFVAAEFLRQVAPADRDDVVTWTRADIDRAGYSPVTTEHLVDGLTLAELAEAAVRESDNTAANLIIERLGGPAALDAGLELLGDTTTAIVDDEPALNVVSADSADNTTTPAAFTANLGALLDGQTLATDDLETLVDWMSGNATGDNLVRAGAPSGWVVADKSGGAGGIRNDIAIVTPPGRAPLLVSILTTKTDVVADYQDELVADVAAVVLGAFA
jgi:beta-lactamase class A